MKGTLQERSLSAPQGFLAERVEQVFFASFAARYRTQLRGGADEPLYQPAPSAAHPHLLFYRSDHFASALHEVAHWCIAGDQRRQLTDFGYWYIPDSRAVDQQLAFQAVECKPQALEWFFSQACGYRFQVSVDNPGLACTGLLDTAAFQHAVLTQALTWQQQGLPERAGEFYAALCHEFGTAVPAAELVFTYDDLA